MGMTTDELYFKPRLQVVNDDQIARIHMATLGCAGTHGG